MHSRWLGADLRWGEWDFDRADWEQEQSDLGDWWRDTTPGAKGNTMPKKKESPTEEPSNYVYCRECGQSWWFGFHECVGSPLYAAGKPGEKSDG